MNELKESLLLLLCVCLLVSGVWGQSRSECSNYGMSFTGKNGFQSSDDWYEKQVFTLMFWLNVRDEADVPQGVVQAFIVKGVSSCDVDGFGFYRYNKTMYFIAGGTTICGDGAIAFDMVTNKWTHVAVAVRENRLDLYVDGVLLDGRAKSTIRFGNNLAPFKVGLGPDPDSGFDKGELDEVQFWGVYKSASEIKSSYEKSLTDEEITDDLLAYWRFEDGSNILVSDSSTFDREVIVSSTLDYVANCKVAYCLCGTTDYCVPDNDRTNLSIECPTTSASSSTRTPTTSASTRSTTSSAATSTTTRSTASTTPGTRSTTFFEPTDPSSSQDTSYSNVLEVASLLAISLIL